MVEERQTKDGSRILEKRYSNCNLLIKNHITPEVLMDYEIKEGITLYEMEKKGRIHMPCFSLINVRKFNPIIHTYSELHGQKLIIPSYRKSDSTRYFQGVSFVYIPGEINISGSPIVSVDVLKNGFRDDKKSFKNLNLAYFPLGLEKALGYIDQSSEVIPVEDIMITEKFRDFFINPPKMRIERLFMSTYLPLQDYGEICLDKTKAREIYLKRMSDFDKKFRLNLPKNYFIFD